MAKENSTDPAIPQSQQIPPSKMHDLPGVFVRKQPDMAIPSKPVPASNKGQKADVKETKNSTTAAGDKDKGKAKTAEAAAPTADDRETLDQATPAGAGCESKTSTGVQRRH